MNLIILILLRKRKHNLEIILLDMFRYQYRKNIFFDQLCFINLIITDWVKPLIRNQQFLHQILKKRFNIKMQIDNHIHQITVHPPKIQPKITTVGYGNPRYNTMLVYQEGVLISVGSHLRLVNLKQNKILYDKQIGCCQIFQIIQNSKYILVVNFDGFISFLNKKNLEITYQFQAPGKQIRHSSLSEKYLAVSCQLMNGTDQALLLSYSIANIQQNIFEPIASLKGHYYYPEYQDDSLTVLEYKDPNPKGRKRKQTVLTQKLPIVNQIVKLSLDFKIKHKYCIVGQGQVICATRNKGIIYYLQTSKRITLFNVNKEIAYQLALTTKSMPHIVQNYKDGIVYPAESNKLMFIQYDFDTNKLHQQIIQIKSLGIGGNLSLKFSQDGIYTLNQNGFHFYSNLDKKTFTQSLFSITNCGIVFNSTGDLFAVADFGGSFFIFNSQNHSVLPDPLFTIFVGIPIRSIAWCPTTNNIAIGCTDGGLYWWQYGNQEATLIHQVDTTINILRAVGQKIYAGACDGRVTIFQSKTMKVIGEYQAHHPINYETEEQREMFGSMKHYAEIWSLTIPTEKQELIIVSSCEDQTEKVFKANLQTQKYEMIHHLKGHELAVTSIDWKLMNEKIGEIYVSCSDDKIIRFRDPQNHFKVLFQVKTTTIKEWHTLTYLALEPKGHRVAIGSQNGYLFIYDIEKRDLLFGQKIHLGGIEGLDWSGNKICTCSSDLCVNILEL